MGLLPVSLWLACINSRPTRTVLGSGWFRRLWAEPTSPPYLYPGAGLGQLECASSLPGIQSSHPGRSPCSLGCALHVQTPLHGAFQPPAGLVPYLLHVPRAAPLPCFCLSHFSLHLLRCTLSSGLRSWMSQAQPSCSPPLSAALSRAALCHSLPFPTEVSSPVAPVPSTALEERAVRAVLL